MLYCGVRNYIKDIFANEYSLALHVDSLCFGGASSALVKKKTNRMALRKMFNPQAAICLWFLFLSCFSSLFIVGVYCYPPQLFENSSCKNGRNPGICKLVSDCPTARKAADLRQRHHLERCGFEGFTEVVCCPSTDFKIMQYHYMTTEQVWSEEPWTKKPHKKVTTPTTRPLDVSKRPQMRNPETPSKSAQYCEKVIKDVGFSISYNIVKGEIAGEGEFPHMAALGYKSSSGEIKFGCGASLISNRYVVTAAHCVTTRDKVTVVRLGQIDVPEAVTTLTSNDYLVADAKIHPEYKWKEKLNDIALIRLDRKVATTNAIYPACLYPSSDDPSDLIISGWGATSLEGARSDVLRKAKLEPVVLKECKRFFATKNNITETQICASHSESDACQGDSGGPLQILKNNKGSLIYSIVGVTSFGFGCASRFPGIYTRIYSYIDWIETEVWP